MFLVGGTLLVTSVVIGNAWQRHVGGDDSARFDRRTLRVDDAVSGDTVLVVEPDGRLTPVRLLGVAAPEPAGASSAASPSSRPRSRGATTTPSLAAAAGAAAVPHWSDESRRALAGRVAGRDVLLRLPPLAQRSADGTVRAYLYLAGGTADSVNDVLVAAGDAYADRRVDHPMRKAFEQAESEARRKRRGLWKDVRDDEQPAWRQVWLRGLKEAKGR